LFKIEKQGKMSNTLNVLFYIRQEKKTKKGRYPLYCRITAEKQRATFSLQRHIDSSNWDSLKELVTPGIEEGQSINAYISHIRNKVYEAHYRLLANNTPVTADAIKRLVLNKEQIKSRSVFKVFEEHNKKVKTLIGASFAYGTYERYQTTFKHIKDFVNWKYERDEFYLHEIDHEFITEFDYYLRAVRKCGNNTVVKYIKNFGKIIRYSLANSWIKHNPLINYKVRLSRTDRGYLTTEELDLLAKKSFSIKRLDQVRDVFVFQCHTGLAYCDVFKLTQENLIRDDKGVLWIKTKRTKTDNPVSVPLLSSAEKIIEKYQCKENSNEKLLPVLSNQKMNAYLKEIADVCGIQKSLSSHLARHTFATTVTLANGISLESVSKMLGHSNLVTTKIYARMLDSRVLDEMQMLQHKMSTQKGA
jgi:site-specific recombinase XerD